MTLITHSEHTTMRQVAPYPHDLADLVGMLRFRRHLEWRVWLEHDLQRDKPGRHTGESRGLTLIVQRCGPDSYHHEHTMRVNHYFAVPPATYDRRSWQRWLFDRLGDVDTHERMEDFTLALHDDGDGGEHLVRPYAPSHNPGSDPYAVRELSTWAEVDTDFRGNRVHPGTASPSQSDTGASGGGA
jgi:hypothetical protein